MQSNIKKRIFSLFIGVVLLTAFYAFNLKEIMKYPDELKIFEGEIHILDIKFPLNISEDTNIEKIVKLYDEKGKFHQRIYLKSDEIGKSDLQVKLLGLLPIKSMKINVIPKIKMIPGGQSIGVRLNTKGVLVVDLEEIQSEDGRKYNPGYHVGLRIGDSILEFNQEKIKNAEHLTNLIERNKNMKVKLMVKRNKNVFNVEIVPIKSKEDGAYRLGLWVRDKTAGVGTMTFYHPETMKFGALGHAITDIDTGLLLSVDSGEIVKSKVASIEQGKRGKPGEIKGLFYESSKPIGNLEKNTQFGIYGKSFEKINNPLYSKPLEVGFQNQVREGKANILTTLDNNQIEAYEVLIEKVNHQKNPGTKSMVIKVIDKKLLERTGGIVQGMSGSPIIQDGKLIGAVTHVFVHDPTKGYGLFIEWMLKECDISINTNSQVATKSDFK